MQKVLLSSALFLQDRLHGRMSSGGKGEPFSDGLLSLTSSSGSTSESSSSGTTNSPSWIRAMTLKHFSRDVFISQILPDSLKVFSPDR